MKPLFFFDQGTLDEFRNLPDTARRAFGYQLSQVQDGDTPENAKPLKYLGKGVKGVFELVQPLNGNTYRVAYVARFERAVVVLHSWKKKTQKTAQADKDLIVKRYRQAREEYT